MTPTRWMIFALGLAIGIFGAPIIAAIGRALSN